MSKIPAKKSLWGYGITATYTLFALATVGFVYFAFTQRVDIVTDEYYEKGLEHDKVTAARQRAKELPSLPVVSVQRSGNVTIQLPEPHTTIAVKGSVLLYRPSNPAMDKTAEFATSSGEHSFEFPPLAQGLWRYTLQWQVQGVDYQVEQEVYLD